MATKVVVVSKTANAGLQSQIYGFDSCRSCDINQKPPFGGYFNLTKIINNMNEFKWADGFDNGALRDQLVFLKKFNINPNMFVYQLDDDSLDLNSVDMIGLKQEFPNAEIVTQSSKSQKSTSCVQDEFDDEEESDNEIYIAGEWLSSLIRIYDDKIIYYIDSDGIRIWYYNQDPEEAVKRVLKFIPFKVVKPKEAEIKLVAFNQEYYTIDSKIQPTKINIDENYNDDIKPVLEDVKKFLNERKSGLILFRGKIGVGKTNLIRHLITTFPKNYILVTNTLASHLASPEFISFMLDHKNSVFILEDCEQILMAREQNISSAIANILNMSDGLMSDIFNVKFICTFNADIDKIDDAILRKGRCFANYEFKPLCKEKTKALLEKQNIHIDDPQPMTLAEIYNYSDGDCTKQSTKKIGF